ncbi:MAG: hypothetical protein ISS59_00950 [Desulfobacteraceae bacterium]|nr:hypothetical protein [Desulfobacteraceae bacterium]
MTENLTENKRSDVTVDSVALSDALGAMSDVKDVLVFVAKTAKHTGYDNPGPFVEMVDKIIPNQIDSLESVMDEFQDIDWE